MAIVCQVIHRPQRVTFIWSEAGASFEPYHLAGAQLEEFFQAARLGREQLARVVRESASTAGPDLARAGHRLHRAIFPDQVRTVRDWLRNQENQQTDLEILSDMPGRVPWNIVCDESPNEAAWHAGALPNAFWGFRWRLGVGRRVNALRTAAVLESPTVMMAIDPVARDGLPIEQKNRLTDFASTHQASVFEALEDFTGALQNSAPDILFVLSRVDGGRPMLGPGSLTAEDLRDWLAEARAGNPDPVVILGGVGEENQWETWECFVGSSVRRLAGVVTSEVPAPGGLASSFGLDGLGSFLGGGVSLAEALRAARRKHGLAGLAFSAFCPGFVRVSRPDEEIEPVVAPRVEPLPAHPYRPFAPFEREDRGLLAGRAEDTIRCAGVFDEATTRGLVVHGYAGVGKSSFIRAGVVPFLEDECVGYHAMRDRSPEEPPASENDYPVLAIHPGGDLTGQIAEAISAFCEQPYTFDTPTGETIQIDLPGLLGKLIRPAISDAAIVADLGSVPGTALAAGAPAAGTAALSAREIWQALRIEPAMLGRILDGLCERLPFELVLFIEQGEELFSEATAKSGRRRTDEAVALLDLLFESPARCKVILALRTDVHGWFVDHCKNPWREFWLREPTQDELFEALVLPTSQAVLPYSIEVPHTKYGFAYEEGVAEDIVDEIADKARIQGQSALSLIQAAGALVYQGGRKRGQELVRDVDRKALGDLESAMVQLVEQTIRSLPLSGNGKRGVHFLLDKLHGRQSDGSSTPLLASWKELQRQWTFSEPLDRVVETAAEAGLVEVHRLLVQGQEGLYLGLPQDSLAKLGEMKVSEARRRAYARNKVIDTLWVMIPLLFLAAAITFTVTRSFSASRDESTEAEQIREFAIEKVRELQNTRWPIYAGAVARAQLALEAGNPLLVRQNLLTQLPGKEQDLRGFDWYYLWRQIHRERRSLAGQRATVLCLALSADGGTLASGGADGSLKLWDLKEGQLKADLLGHTGPVHALAFSPSGKTLASAGEDKTIRLWDGQAGKDKFAVVDKEQSKLEGGATFLSLAFGKDEVHLASGAENGKVTLWNTESRKEEAAYAEHKGPVRALCFTTDGNNLASGGDDQAILICAAKGGKAEQTIQTAGPVQALIFISEEEALAAGVNERQRDLETGVIRFWNPATGKELGKALHHAAGVFGLAYVPASKVLVSAGKDNVIRSWDTTAGVEVAATLGHLGWVRSLAASADGSHVVSGSYDAQIKIWDPKQFVEADILAHPAMVEAVAFSGDDKVLASGSSDGVVRLWNPATGALVGALAGHKGSISAVAFLPTDKNSPRKLAVASYGAQREGEIKTWELADAAGAINGKELHAVKETAGFTCLAVSSDGKLLAAGNAAGAVLVWDAETAKPKQTMKGHQGAVRCVTFVPRTHQLASGGADAAQRFWDADSGKESRPTLSNVHPGGVNAVGFFLDQVRFVTAGADQTVKIWEWQAREPAPIDRILRSHSQPVACLAVSPGLDFVATGSSDKTVKLFNLVHGKVDGKESVSFLQERFTLTGHAGAVRALAISNDRLIIASASQDGTVRLWRAADPELVNPTPEQ